MSLVIIIPTYNEKENISRIIHELFSHVPHAHIVVVDDNSPDGTAGIVTDLKKKYPQISLLSRIKKEGLGRAYTHAFDYVLATHNPTRIVMMDADLSHAPHYVAEMDRIFKPGNVIVGSRYVSGGGTVGWEKWRKWLSYYGNLYSRSIVGIPVNDLTAGFYMIDADLLRSVDTGRIASSGYAFQIELKYLLHEAGAQFLELPIVFTNRVGGESKISNHIVREGLLAPWRIRFFVRTNPSAVPACILCGHSHVSWGEKNGYTLYQCTTCKLISVYPLPDPSQIYVAEYFSGAEHGFGYVDYDTDKEPMRDVFERYLDICAQYGKISGTFLDVGAATGFFMNIARARGYQVYGVEVSDFAAQKGRDAGLSISTNTLLTFETEKKFDVISLCDVLEHMTDPRAELHRAHELLSDKGLMIINTPNGESLLARLLKARWHLVVPPEHVYYFSPHNLADYLSVHGFTVLHTSTISKRFTCAYIFQTLYKWQQIALWKWCAQFSEKHLSWLSIPLNLYDNFFMVVQKK